MDDILANDNTDAPAIVTIAGCPTRASDLRHLDQRLVAAYRQQAKFDDGMYFVGTDIKPGTYEQRANWLLLCTTGWL